MKLLAIETSTHQASVALKIEGAVYQLEEMVLQRHAEFVLPAVSDLLAKANVSLAELDGIVFGRGPGSFTGLRIACSMAKGLALGAGLPLYPVSGLGSILAQVNEQDVLAVIDARMQAWYWSYGQELIEQLTASADIVLTGNQPIFLAGVGFESLLDTLPQSLLTRLSGTKVIYPTALSMINLVEAGQVEAVTPEEARPTYIRQEVTHG